MSSLSSEAQYYTDKVHWELIRRGIEISDIPELLLRSGYSKAITMYPELQILQPVNQAVDEILYLSQSQESIDLKVDLKGYISAVEVELETLGVDKKDIPKYFAPMNILTDLECDPLTSVHTNARRAARQIIDARKESDSCEE